MIDAGGTAHRRRRNFVMQFLGPGSGRQEKGVSVLVVSAYDVFAGGRGHVQPPDGLVVGFGIADFVDKEVMVLPRIEPAAEADIVGQFSSVASAAFDHAAR